MNSNETTNDPLAQSARRLRRAVLLACVTILVLYVFARLGLDVGVVKVMLGERETTPVWTLWLLDAEVALLLAALFRLGRTLGLLAEGEMFSVVAVRSFRAFAFWLMLSAIVGFLGPLLTALLQTGDGPVQLRLDLRQLLVFGITLLLFLLARLLERARRLEEEAREII